MAINSLVLKLQQLPEVSQSRQISTYRKCSLVRVARQLPRGKKRRKGRRKKRKINIKLSSDNGINTR
jgi:hypothetical protein